MVTPPFSPDFIDRLLERVADPVTRTDALDFSPTTSYLDGAFETFRVPIGAGTPPPPGPAPLPPPATAEEVSSVEARLGFALPGDLVQLYRQVANGGFGPAGGLASVEAMTERYQDLRRDSPLVDGTSWPEFLLPIGLAEPGVDCYELRSGRIVYWDEEVGTDTGQSAGHAFKPEADSLQAWLEAWLSRPPLPSQLRQDIEEGLLESMRTTLAYWRAMLPEERAEYGLSSEGWEEELFGHLGIDLSGL